MVWRRLGKKKRTLHPQRVLSLPSYFSKSRALRSVVPMVRRIPTQVHQQVSRLLKTSFIKREPAWYRAVLDNPPLPLPARAPPRRTAFDAPTTKPALPPRKTPGVKPLPITYLEDEVRRQFFRDHPFETYRPVSLVEAGAIEEQNPIQGAVWTRLRQRGRNPSPEEYVTLSLLFTFLYSCLMVIVLICP